MKLGRLLRSALVAPLLALLPSGAQAQWAPTQIPNLAFWLPAFNTSVLWKDYSGTSVIDRAAVIGDSVGQVDDPSPCAHRAQALGSGNRPVLGNSGARSGFLTFTAASTHYLSVTNSLTAFNFAHSGGAVSICVWVLCGTDSTLMTICDSAASTSANAGITLTRTSANKVALTIGRATSGTFMVNFTSAATLNIASGWTPITVTIPAGSGTGTGTMRVGAAGSDETFNVAAGAAVNASFNLLVGARASSLAGPWNGSLSDLIIVNAVMSGSDLTSYRAYNPNIVGSWLTTPASGAATLLPSDLNFLTHWFDFSDAANLYTDTAKTTHVAGDGDPIYVAANKAAPAFTLSRDLIAASTGVRPLWRTNTLNGRATAKFDGVDDSLDLATALQGAGAQSLYLVCDTPTINGAPIVWSETAGAGYWTVTGSTYVGNPNSFVNHSNDASIANTTSRNLVNADSWNIIEVVRNGSSLRCWVNGVEGLAAQTGGGSAILRMGWSNDGTRFWPGHVAEFVAYRAVHNDINRSKLRAGLTSKWKISNVQTLSVGGSGGYRPRPRPATVPLPEPGRRKRAA